MPGSAPQWIGYNASMTTIRMGLAIAALLMAPAVSAKPPPGQGRFCDARNKCTDGLQCIAHRDGKSTCELVCATSKNCPEDQRCVKDGPQMVCRPINDLTL
jgi:hypothetical protein